MESLTLDPGDAINVGNVGTSDGDEKPITALLGVTYHKSSQSASAGEYSYLELFYTY